ncbi:MAG: glycosyl transferase family 1 [Hyphomicrobiales bacterium]|nr:glycosyl transferase family 1 [Hyphomicrobiales bacterium]
MRLAIGIATKGRAELLRKTVEDVFRQSRQPDAIFICGVGPEDYAGIEPRTDLTLLNSEAGLTRQRNKILAVADCDVILFLDDDFLMAADFLSIFEAAFQAHPDLACATGRVLADGIKTPGIPFDEGRDMLTSLPPAETSRIVDIPHGYGCNMAFRMSVLRENGIHFDEALPLYAWYEDIDVMRRAGRHGRMVRLEAARGVHLGTKGARISGRKFGYSQISNPVYLARKGTYPWPNALMSMVRNLAANVARLPFPESYVDRRGRLVGNMLGLADIARGIVNPGKVLEL